MKLQVSLILILYIVLYKRKKEILSLYQYINNIENKRDENTLVINAFIGFIAGLLISLIETITTYDDLISKTNKLISISSILQKSNDQFVHGLVFFILGALLCLLTNSIGKSTNIPLWSQVLGLIVGFVITLQIIKKYHSSRLIIE